MNQNERNEDKAMNKTVVFLIMTGLLVASNG
jgi:hypothetical protein